MNIHIETIEAAIAEQREVLKDHKMYRLLSDIDDIKLFMEKHVYAVWDFMSLLKALQANLTCITVPWQPAKNAKIARFINEIVLGEETDVNEKGVPKSHFEMYLDAMQEVKANTEKVLHLIHQLTSLEQVDKILTQSSLKPAELAFLQFTFEIIKSNEPHKIAAAFTFGREDLIPDMFIQIIEQSNEKEHYQFPKLTYYLERHIEVDGDEHGPLALEMISELCGKDSRKWEEVNQVAQIALAKRIELWDEIALELEQKQVLAEA